MLGTKPLVVFAKVILALVPGVPTATLPFTESGRYGLLVPTPTFPFLSTMNDVAVDEPTTRPGRPPRLLIDSLANGDVVEKPTLPVNWLVFVNVLKSDSNVEDANDHVDVEKL